MTPHSRQPVLWFQAAVDLRDLSGVTLYHRSGGGDVVMPTFDTDLDEGIYDNAIALACGRGSSASAADSNARRDLTSEWQVQHPDGFAEGGVRLTAGDCLQLWCSATFDLAASADNAIFGLPVAGATAELNILSGEYRITGTTDWQRGPLEDDAHITIQPDAGGAAFDLPRYPYRAQGLVELVRRRGRTYTEVMGDYELGDYDADDAYAATCIEALDNATNDYAGERVRHYIDTTGHYCMAWPTSLSLGGPVFDSTAFRDRIGATGSLAFDSQVDADMLTTVGDLKVWRAGKPFPGAAHTTRPWVRKPQQIHGERTEAERLVDGGAASHQISEWTDTVFEFWLDGPESPHTEDDIGAHWATQMLGYCPLGAPLTVFVGMDTRRHIPVSSVNSTTPAFSDLYSADPCGGRYHGWCRSPDDEATVTIEYDEDAQGGQYWARATMRISPPRT